MPNVLSTRDLVSRPDNTEETVLSSLFLLFLFHNGSIVGLLLLISRFVKLKDEN